MAELGQVTASAGKPRAGAKPGARNAWRWLRRTVLITTIAAISLVGIGFWQFLNQIDEIDQIDRQTAGPLSAPAADAIVVLTGGRARLEAGVRLLMNGYAKRLLVSGVHRSVSERTLRDILGVSRALYDCCIDVDREALDTAGNAANSAHWVHDNGFESLIVVTNDYHMPRSMLEMRRVLPDVALAAYPVVNGDQQTGAFAAGMDRYRVLIGEYAKYLFVAARPPIS